MWGACRGLPPAGVRLPGPPRARTRLFLGAATTPPRCKVGGHNPGQDTSLYSGSHGQHKRTSPQAASWPGRQERRGRGGRASEGASAPTDPQKWTPREDREAERGRGPGRGLREWHSKCKGPWGKRVQPRVGRAGRSRSLESDGLPLPPWADTRRLRGGKRSPQHTASLSPEPAPSPTTLVP